MKSTTISIASRTQFALGARRTVLALATLWLSATAFGQQPVQSPTASQPGKVVAVLAPALTDLTRPPRCESPGRFVTETLGARFAMETQCPLAEIAAGERSPATVTEIRDAGRFRQGLLELSANALGRSLASVSPPSPCEPQRLTCGQTVTPAGGCRLAGGYAALWELDGFAGESLRLELTGGERAELLLVDPDLWTDNASKSRHPGSTVIDHVLDQTGLWGVALAIDAGDDLDRYRLSVTCDGLEAAVTGGTYTGTHSLGGEVEFEVANNQIQSFKLKALSCPQFSLTEAGVSFPSGCSIANDGSFSCGSTGCAPFQFRVRATGQFSGNNVAGQMVFNGQPSATASCCQRTVDFSASRSGGGPGPTQPAAPSELTATALSATSVRLDWRDNSNNEDEFRIEMRMGSGAFSDIGGVAANATSSAISNLSPSTSYDFRVRARNAAGNSAYSNTASATTQGLPTGCTPASNVHCLQGNRFKVEVDWRNQQGATGRGVAVPETSNTGLFWFFSSDNIEMLLKVLSGCAINNHFWMFAAATTNVEYTLRVTDTQTGAERTYFNPLGTAAQPIQDTAAFATCP